MIQATYSAVAGMVNQQTMLEVITNNLANVTYDGKVILNYEESSTAKDIQIRVLEKEQEKKPFPIGTAALILAIALIIIFDIIFLQPALN